MSNRRDAMSNKLLFAALALFFTGYRAQIIFAPNSICEIKYAMNISEGEKDADQNITYHGYVYAPGEYFLNYNDEPFACVCDFLQCVRKCCNPSKHKCNSTALANLDNEIVFQDLEKDSLIVSVYHNLQCDDGFEVNLDEVVVRDRGDIVVKHDPSEYPIEDNCIGIDKDNRKYVWLCRGFENDDQGEDPSLLIYQIGMFISLPFLAITLIIYILIPNKNIHTKYTMFYIGSFFFGYLFYLITYQYTAILNNEMCMIFGGLGIYFFQSAFCWMTVICCSMYCTFRYSRPIASSRSSQLFRIGRSLLFANGVPLILIILIFTMNSEVEDTPWYHSGIGVKECWITTGYPRFTYFYGPMAVLLMINLGLFLLTAIKIYRTTLESKNMLRNMESRRHFASYKQDYVLFVKLFLAMGINWSMEVISWMVNWQYPNAPLWIWYATDFCNTIYGVIIFIIFICKRSVWRKLCDRFSKSSITIRSRSSDCQMTQVDQYNSCSTQSSRIDSKKESYYE